MNNQSVVAERVIPDKVFHPAAYGSWCAGASLFMCALFLVFGTWFAVPFVYADPSSTNYGISESYFPAAVAGAMTSTNYSVNESTLDSFLKTSTSSSNYAAEGKVGVDGVNRLPIIQSVTPAAARFYSDESASFVVTATNPNSSTLQYEALQDGTVKAGPQTGTTLTWSLSGSDLGKHTYKLEVIDSTGTVIQPQTGYVFRKPVK